MLRKQSTDYAAPDMDIVRGYIWKMNQEGIGLSKILIGYDALPESAKMPSETHQYVNFAGNMWKI